MDFTFIISIAVSFMITMALMPHLMDRLRKAGITGVDVNKPDKPVIPEMGGLACLIVFSLTLFVVSLIKKALSIDFDLMPIYSVLFVFAIAALIGALDDLRGISRGKKAIYLMLASIPLLITQTGNPIIFTPFYNFDFTVIPWFYWFIVVPVGITGAANALNMQGGYNGLESGEVVIISFFLLIISYIAEPDGSAVLIFGALFGTALALYAFNNYPAKVFVGNVGSFGMGAAIAAGVIVGDIEFFGAIFFLLAFYELFATIYYKIKGIERRAACMNPIILKDELLKPPESSEKYTLFYLLLSKKPRTERQFKNLILSIYVLLGVVALSMSIISGMIL
jgi:UDP-N-acetylglucosamine--dolichyl-phosphate N-acetylglucosaminephosphotransferase